MCSPAERCEICFRREGSDGRTVQQMFSVQVLSVQTCLSLHGIAGGGVESVWFASAQLRCREWWAISANGSVRRFCYHIPVNAILLARCDRPPDLGPQFCR
jgi:hypothetical protein